MDKRYPFDPRGLRGYLEGHVSATARSPLWDFPIGARYVPAEDVVEVLSDDGDVLRAYHPSQADRRIPLDTLVRDVLRTVVEDHRQTYRRQETEAEPAAMRARQREEYRRLREEEARRRAEAARAFSNPVVGVGVETTEAECGGEKEGSCV